MEQRAPLSLSLQPIDRVLAGSELSSFTHLRRCPGKKPQDAWRGGDERRREKTGATREKNRGKKRKTQRSGVRPDNMFSEWSGQGARRSAGSPSPKERPCHARPRDPEPRPTTASDHAPSPDPAEASRVDRLLIFLFT